MFYEMGHGGERMMEGMEWMDERMNGWIDEVDQWIRGFVDDCKRKANDIVLVHRLMNERMNGYVPDSPDSPDSPDDKVI